MNKTNHTSKGFSILEMVVYIAILVLMLGVIMNVTVSVVRSHRAIKASKNVENSAIISLERITREVRQADSINILSSTFNSSPGRLVLDGVDINDNPRTVEFYLDSNAIFLKENGVNLGPLSQPEARVESLIFSLYSDYDSMGVRIEAIIESGTSTYYRSNNFYSSATIR